jgi:hypothetical protein
MGVFSEIRRIVHEIQDAEQANFEAGLHFFPEEEKKKVADQRQVRLDELGEIVAIPLHTVAEQECGCSFDMITVRGNALLVAADAFNHWDDLDTVSSIIEFLNKQEGWPSFTKDTVNLVGTAAERLSALRENLDKALEAVIGLARDGAEPDASSAEEVPRRSVQPGRESPAVAGRLPDSNTIVSLGDRHYSIGAHQGVIVSAREDAVLRAFIVRCTLDNQQLRLHSQVPDPDKHLRDLTTKYDRIFASAITLPGRKGRRGYGVKIVKG